MTLTRTAAKVRIARQLKSAESMLDASMRAISELTATLVAARDDNELAPHTGQDSLIRLARVQTALVNASTDVFRVHGGIAKIGVELGIMDEEVPTDPMGLADDVQQAQAA